jgi:outer membrane protein assembly factor BamB
MKLLTLCLGALLVSSSVQSLETAPWGSFRNGFQNTGLSSVSYADFHRVNRSREVSRISVGGLIWGTAVIDSEENTYVGSSNKFFYSLDKNGQLRWQYQIFDKADSLIDSAAVLAPNNLVIVPGGDGFLHALDRTTGERQWVFKADQADDQTHSEGSVVNSFEGNVQLGPNNILYAGSDNGHMYALNLQGEKVWNLKTNMMIWSSPSFSPQGDWMVFGSLDGYVYLVHPETGKLYDKYRINQDVKSSPSVDKNGHIYVGASNFNFYSFKVVKNRLVKRWKFKKARGEIYSSPALYKDRLVFGSLDGSLYCLSKNTGKMIWKYETFSPIAASPLITKDGKVLFGAKNGKLYLVDIMTGKRIWSYRTTKSRRKTNLDASPALGRNGVITVSSYQGHIYRVPLEYCSISKDKNCEHGGDFDQPAFRDVKDQNASTLQYLSPMGHYRNSPKHQVNLTELFKLRLVVLNKGKWRSDRAIQQMGLRIKVYPETEIVHKVSPDGQFLNILPKKAWKPNTKYTVTISGRHYKQTNWLLDRVILFGKKKMGHKFSFQTIQLNAPTNDVLENGSLGITSMFLEQPQALDTYIPAALDGQAFIATQIAANKKKNKFLTFVIPAFPSPEGPIPMAEPSKSFVMNTTLVGKSYNIKGSLKLAAMGGTIDFDNLFIRGTLPKYESKIKGTFLAEANCLKIKGNGSSYNFPFKLINRICDRWMMMRGVGDLTMTHLTAEGHPQIFSDRDWLKDIKIEMAAKYTRVNLPQGLEKDGLLSYVVYTKDLKLIEKKSFKLKKEQRQMVISTPPKGNIRWFINHLLVK